MYVGVDVRIVAFLIAFCLCPTIAGAASQGDRVTSGSSVFGTTTWVNRQGSVMVLDLGPDGRLQGYFVNNAPGKGCRGIPYDLKGRVLGEAVAFHVNWRNGVADCRTRTEWRGHLQRSPKGAMQIVSEWRRSSVVITTGLSEPASLKGEDLFTQQVVPALRPKL